MTVATFVIGAVRNNQVFSSSVWGVCLILWVLTGVAWIVTRYVTLVVEAQARQAKQIKKLAEAAKVAGWATAMEEETNVRNINRR